ncbi:MAG TPA: proline dehydrogenase family protein, partial [Bdellovibrionales bacterium]|nr:proline dehydrogenase family protein [Bdellovibrionales bacterium]
MPVFLNKRESDACFELCAKKLIDAYPYLRLAVGSHNVRSISAAVAYAKAKGLDPRAVEIQMLFGMGDSIKKALVRDGFRVREYATIGELIPGMAYLVRRLLENTSNESFLRSKFADNVSSDVLLKDPTEGLVKSDGTPERDPTRFHNEPPLDFAIRHDRETMIQALSEWRGRLGRTYPLVIDGKEITTARKITRENPAKTTEIVGHVSAATNQEAEHAVQAAKKALPAWAKTAPDARADLLDKLADKMAAEKYRLAALQVLEIGKSWREADGDVAEAIDFCRYYARDMRRLGKPFRVGRAPGEVSLYHYQPRGVTLVIAPWNFPLAILSGMVGAALVTGNTVVMKPAEQSSIIASELQRMILEVGFPKGVCHFLPGYGEEVGEYLVNHKDTAMIAFTGSKPVGLSILQKAAVVHPGQTHIKRVLAELGGKNAIIVDSDADLDEVVAGMLYSAFGFQGQKCSACSRAIVLEPIYDRFLERLTDAAKSLFQGPPEDPRMMVGPVVDQEAYERIRTTISQAKNGNRLAFEGAAGEGGDLVPPASFAHVDPNSGLAQKEIF